MAQGTGLEHARPPPTAADDENCPTMVAVSEHHSQTQVGGYDLELFCDSEVPDKLVCSICMKVLCQPRLTECCGQHFCEACLSHWARRGTSSCPHCRQQQFVHIRNKALRREINQLKVTCYHREDGCIWTGELGQLDCHLRVDCGQVTVNCPNGCCLPEGSQLKRIQLTAHLQNRCYLRKYKCEYCSYEDTYGAITGRFGDLIAVNNHYNSDCPNYPLKCPNRCGVENIKRKDMTEHINQCPQELVGCPNKCRTKVWPLSKDREGAVNKHRATVCNWRIETTRLCRFELATHLKSMCYLRSYSCVQCGHMDTYHAITGRGGPWPHSAMHECPERPCDCPNNCGTKDLRHGLLMDHKLECPLEPVQCPLAEAGCEASLLRRDLEDHLASNVQRHLLLAFHTVNALKEKCNKLEEENRILRLSREDSEEC